MTVTLEWADNTEGDFYQYKMYWGRQSGVYTASQTTVAPILTVSNLIDGVTYYFAVTAMDVVLNESSFSSEVSKINKISRRVRVS